MRGLVVVALLLLSSAPAFASTIEPLAVKTADGKTYNFKVEVATTEQEREVGLMNRPQLAADGGMIFDFGSDQSVAMWMKNTLIPLDMLFLAADGTIQGIAQRAVPMSTTIIPSPGPVRAVVELNGGTTDRLGIKVGDKIEEAMFKH